MLIKDLAELEVEGITHEDVDYFSPDELKILTVTEFREELKRRKQLTDEKVRNFRRAFKNQYKIALRTFSAHITTPMNAQQIAEQAMRMAAQELMSSVFNSPAYIGGGVSVYSGELENDETAEE